MLKKKKTPSTSAHSSTPKEAMSFTIDTSDMPARAKKLKKKVRVSESSRHEDQDSVDAAAAKQRRLKNKGKKATRATMAPRSTEEAEIVEVKKKIKKTPGRALVVANQSNVKRISKLDQKELNSIIGDDAEEMQNLFEEDNTDQAVRLLNRRLIQTCIDLIPQLETGIRSSNGRYGVHSLNGTIQTIRELVIDLQSMQDRGAIGESIVEKIIRPTILDVATKLVEEQATVLSEIKDLVSSEVYTKFRQAQLDSRNRLASMINSKYEFMRTETVNFLQR